MARINAPDLGTLSLNPTARPVNTFAPTEVRQGKGASDDLVGLARGLSQLEPTLQQVADRRIAAYEQNSQQRGENAQAALGLENQAAFRQAVKDGKISESGNPWFMLGLKKSVAGVEADKASRDLFDAYNQNEVQHSDHPADVEDFAKKFLAPTLKGRDADELSEIVPRFNHEVNRLVTFHVARRDQERKDEMEIAAGEELSAAVTAFKPQSTPEEIAAAQSGIAAWAEEKGKFLTRPTLNKIITQTAKANALASGNADAFLRTLESIKTTGGKTLADTAQNQLEYQEIQAELVGKAASASRQEEHARQQQAKSAAGAVMSAMVKDRASAPDWAAGHLDFDRLGFDQNWVDKQEATNAFSQDPELNHDTADFLRQVMVQYNDRGEHADDRQYTLAERERMLSEHRLKQGQEAATTDVYSKMAGYFASGKAIPASAMNSMLATAAAAGDPGLVQNAQQAGHFYNENLTRDAQASDPQVVDELEAAHLTGAIADPVFLAKRWSKLSNPDRERFIKIQQEAAEKEKAGTMAGSPALLHEVDNLKFRIVHAARKGQDLDSFKTNDKEAYGAAEDRAKYVGDLLYDHYSEWLNSDEGKNANASQRLATMRVLSDALGKTYQATSREKLAEEVKPPAAGKPAPKPQDKNRTALFPQVEQEAKKDPLLAAVADGSLDLNQLAKVGATPSSLDAPHGYLKTQRAGFGSVVSAFNGGHDADASDPYSKYMNLLTEDTPDKMSLRNLGLILQPFRPPQPTPSADLVKARQSALDTRVKLKQQIVSGNIVSNLQEKLAEFQQRESEGPLYILPNEKQQVIGWADMLQRYAFLTTNVGITPAEAKDLGPEAFMSLPLFATEEELRTTGDKVAQALGLNPHDALLFANAQRVAIYRTHAAAATRAGIPPAIH